MPDDQELRGGMIPGANVLNSLEVAARNTLDWISNKVSAISPAGWVLLAIALLALIWSWAVMHAFTRIGPVAVDDLTSDEKDVPLAKLSAEFRRILSQVGLAPPPAVPAGSPQTNLITAIAAVAPQGDAIGKLLSILPTPPTPPQYKVTAVLSTAENSPAAPAPAPAPAAAPAPPADPAQWEVSYTVEPQSRGVPQLARTRPPADLDLALTRAAVEIYQAISQSLPEVFPGWARWRTPESLHDYLHGLDHRTEIETAATWFKKAADKSPYNALAALQLANINERRAGERKGWYRIYFQAQALARYRKIAVQWPEVVTARYRASVVSGELANSYRPLGPIERAAVRAIVPPPGSGNPAAGAVAAAAAAAADDAYLNWLRDFGEGESSASTQLLRRFYAIIRLRRLRNQFEPKGKDRRALLRVLWTSRQCLAMRRRNALPQADRSGVRWLFQRIRMRIRLIRMRILTWTDLPWEARYNAACFYALRLACGVPTAARQGVIERVLRNLAQAIRESSGDLTQSIITADPDMAYFRDAKPDANAA